MKRYIKIMAVFFLAAIIIFSQTQLYKDTIAATDEEKSKWDQLLDKYKEDDDVNQLIFVKYKSGSKATLYLYQKTEEGEWKKLLSCKAYVGKKGINKKKEGDKKTPTGDFKITAAFGRKSNPGTTLKYTKLSKNLYWCSDKKYYNKMINIKKKKHKCKGEHLIKYSPQYDYAMVIGYNTSCKYGKGSAIFLHCKGSKSYTAGCVAVSKSDMKKILKNCDSKTRICIYKK